MYLSTENVRKFGIKKVNWKNRSDIEWRVSHEASFGILVCFMLLLSGTSVSFAQSEKTKQEKTEETTPKLAEQASSAIVIEQDTGKVLFDKTQMKNYHLLV